MLAMMADLMSGEFELCQRIHVHSSSVGFLKKFLQRYPNALAIRR